jgi:thiosulfate/3-mercaptopyruvate sulfurtransferase
MEKLDISNKDTIVCYDDHGLWGSSRAWWTFRVFGHNNVFILNGGLGLWQKNNYPLETG